MMSEKTRVEVEGTGWRGFEQRPKAADMMVEAGVTGSFIHYQTGFLAFLWFHLVLKKAKVGPSSL